MTATVYAQEYIVNYRDYENTFEEKYPEQLLVEDSELNLVQFKTYNSKAKILEFLHNVKKGSIEQNIWDSNILSSIFLTSEKILKLLPESLFLKNKFDIYLSEKGTVFFNFEKKDNYITIEIDRTGFNFFGELFKNGEREIYLYDNLKVDKNLLPKSLNDAIRSLNDTN